MSLTFSLGQRLTFLICLFKTFFCSFGRCFRRLLFLRLLHWSDDASFASFLTWERSFGYTYVVTAIEVDFHILVVHSFPPFFD